MRFDVPLQETATARGGFTRRLACLLIWSGAASSLCACSDNASSPGTGETSQNAETRTPTGPGGDVSSQGTPSPSPATSPTATSPTAGPTSTNPSGLGSDGPILTLTGDDSAGVDSSAASGSAASSSMGPPSETEAGSQDTGGGEPPAPRWRDGGFFDGETRFVIRGVAYNPVRKGGTHPDGLDFSGAVARDAELMKAAGINTVRTYVALTDRDVLDHLYAAGIFVINGVYQYGGSPTSEATAAVDAVKDHPAILMWSIGNEWNYNGLYVDMSFEESLARLNEVATLIREHDTSHPITCIYGEIPSSEVVEEMPLVDVWGINAYRGLSFGTNFFDDYRNNTNKPMFLSEYGADAYDARIDAPNVEAQAEAVRNLTSEILQEVERGVLGGTLFEWSDEWWKDGSGSPSVQDVGGVAPGGGPHPDQTFNEEWWGIVDIDRNPRPAYEELKKLYAQ